MVKSNKKNIHLKSTRINRIINKNKNTGNYAHQQNSFRNTKSDDGGKFVAYEIWKYYSKNCGVHGIRYFTENNLHWSERITWIILVLLALFGSFYVSILLSQRYTTGLLSTVVESTYYHISNVPYPGVSICNLNRLNYNKIDDAIQRFIPNEDKTTKETFRLLLETFEALDFGSFDELLPVANRTFKSLEHLNITAVWQFVMHTCEEMFLECWWRIKFYNCCQILTLQKTEYGICYSFNSATSATSPSVNRSANDWPWRTSSFGSWSGLRIEVSLNVATRLKHSTKPIGLMVIIHHPYEWPNIGYFVPGGSSTSIVITPTSYYTSPDVQRFSPDQRQCIYEDEVDSHEFGDIMQLFGLPYLRSNCVAECRQIHMIKYCNCTLEFFYPNGEYPFCNVTGLICMSKYNDIFNYEKPLVQSIYFDDNDEGISCPCLPECSRIAYGVELQPNLLSFDNRTTSELNIFFKSEIMVRYRTDAKFAWLDLLVSFGGIVGLFLGASLLSCVEIFYHLTIRVFWQCKHRNNILSKTPSQTTVKKTPLQRITSQRQQQIQ